MNSKYHPQNAQAVEAAHPGFIAVAGPYNLKSRNSEVAKEDQTFLDSTLVDQQRFCPHAKRVDHGPMVWIVRKKPRILETDAKNRVVTSGKLGIKGGRAFAS